MRNNPRINCLIPDRLNGVSFYRGLRPLSRLEGVYVDYEPNINWGSLSLCDVLFMIVPFTKELLYISELANNSKTPVWIDFDDNLFSIPEWNLSKKFFNHDNLKWMKKTIANADIITVTTPSLAEEIKQYNENILIIPNAFDDLMFKFEACPSQNKIINWRGSATHSEDLKTILPQIKQIQEEKNFMDWSWNFIGRDAMALKKQLPSAKISDQIGIIEYFYHIRELNPALQIVPLADHPFNKSKSNIAWLEGIYSGAVTIAPDYLPEFQRPGVLHYSDAEDFKKVITGAMANPEGLKEVYMQGYNYIKQHLLLSNVNNMRMELLKKF